MNPKSLISGQLKKYDDYYLNLSIETLSRRFITNFPVRSHYFNPLQNYTDDVWINKLNEYLFYDNPGRTNVRFNRFFMDMTLTYPMLSTT